MSNLATRFTQPMQYDGDYRGNSWAGFKFKETLGYTSGQHTGVDYNLGAGDADKGLPVWAIANGIVRLAANLPSEGYGNTVIIEHELPGEWRNELGTGRVYSRYMHLLDVAVQVGQEVAVGQQIGRVGDSGTEWAHLHLDVWKGNLGVHTRYDKDTELESYLDPYEFIEAHKEEQDEEDEMVTINGLKVLYRFLLGEEPSQYGLERRLGKQTFDQAFREITDSPRYKQYVEKHRQDMTLPVRNLPQSLRQIFNSK